MHIVSYYHTVFHAMALPLQFPTGRELPAAKQAIRDALSSEGIFVKIETHNPMSEKWLVTVQIPGTMFEIYLYQGFSNVWAPDEPSSPASTPLRVIKSTKVIVGDARTYLDVYTVTVNTERAAVIAIIDRYRELSILSVRISRRRSEVDGSDKRNFPYRRQSTSNLTCLRKWQAWELAGDQMRGQALMGRQVLMEQ